MSNSKIKEEVLKEFYWNMKYHKDNWKMVGFDSFQSLQRHFNHHNQQLREAIDLTLKKQQEEFFKILDDYYMNDSSGILDYQDLEKIKQKVRELK